MRLAIESRSLFFAATLSVLLGISTPSLAQLNCVGTAGSTNISINNCTIPPANLGVTGNVAIGSTFVTATPPTNGLIVQGALGVGTTAPSNLLDISGGVAIGTQYVGVSTAPTSGLIVQGNVGIGTTSPTSTLTVYNASGPAIALFNGAQNDTISEGTTGAFTFNNASGNTFAFQQGGSERLRINSGGNVGVGTTSPASLLSVYGGGLAVGTYAATTNIGTGSIIASGSLGIGTNGPLVSLDLSKRTDALALPVGTTGQEPSNALNGMIRYNTTLSDLEAYIAGAWTTLTTGGDSSNYLGTSRLTPNLSASASDTQTGFYTAGTGKVDVSSQGAQVIEISTSGMNVVTGNVGIGTTSPQSSLSVSGGVAIGTTYAGVNTAANNNLIVQGSVGIGTTSPSEALYVNGGNVRIDGTHGYTITGVGQLTALNSTLSLTNGSSSTDITIAPNSKDRLHVVASNGNVGIGTNAPSNLLDVSGGVAIGTQYVGVATAPSNGLIVQGNVGIGTTNPAAALDVYETANAINNGLLIHPVGGTGANARMWSDGSSARISGSSTEANAILLNGGGTGKVGVGTSSPQATLDINGFTKLALNTSAPVACSTATDGSIALTHTRNTCVCVGSLSAWTNMVLGNACVW